MSQADNSVKIDEICQWAIPKHNINATIKSGENPLRFTQVIVLKVKYRWIVGRYLKNGQNLPISNPKADHNINAYTKFGENPLIFTKVIVQK